MNDEDYQVPNRKNDSFNNQNNSMSRHGHNFRGSDLGLNLSNINERGIQNNQNQNRDVNGQQTTNKKYLQNFLNQNLSQSDIQQDNNQVSVSNIGNSNFNSNNLNTPYNHPSQNEKSGYSVGQPSQFQSQFVNNGNNNNQKFKIPGEISPILNGKQSQNYMPKNPQNYGAPVDQSQFMNKRKSSNNTAGSALGLSHLNSGAPDPRKNDNNYACLIIKRMEFYCSKTNLEKHSSYLFRIFDKQEQSYVEATRTAQIRIKLPDNTKPDILMMFIDYLDRGKELPDKIDLYIAQNIVTISESLKMRQIQKKFLMEIIMPMLNRENVIFFVKMAYNKLSDSRDQTEDEIKQDAELQSATSQKDEEDFWLEFLSYTLDLAAANIQYILKMKSVEIHGVLEPNIIDEIIERAIKFYRADLQYDNTILFEALMKIRGCDSIFQLLDQEKSKILESEDNILKSGVRPILTWKVQNLTGNFYRESDGFWVENAQWKLAISYFSSEEDSLKVELKMISNPFDVKNSKDYFKKKEFFLPSNVGMFNQNPIDDYEEYDIRDQEEIQQRRKQIEKANAEYPSHSYITMVSAVRINQDEQLKDPSIQSLICSAKSPAMLKKFQDFYPEDYDGEVTIEIYFKLKFIYSAILHYITRNFTYLITDPIIYMLPKDQLKLILKHKFLLVTQEDEVVKALCLWIEGQEPRDQLKMDLSELLANVQWNFVSIACFLDVIRNFSAFRRNESFKKIVHEEFNMRLKFKADQEKLQPPRFCYKYNKTQTNPEAITKNSKNSKALLFVNYQDFFQKFLDQLLEPVDVIRSHLVNEGVSENAHRKFLELQVLQKQRELQDIQTQLNNMKLMDEMDQSRSNSRLNRNHTSVSRQYHGRSSLDDQETVKNSMINLLNVIDGADAKGNASQYPVGQSVMGNNPNTSNFGEQLRNISQDFVQKMQFNVNNPAESPFENYENQQQPGKDNKVKILFQSVESEDEDEQNEEEPNNFDQTERVNVNGDKVKQTTHLIGGDDMSDNNEEDDDDEEEEKIVFNAEQIRESLNHHQVSANNQEYVHEYRDSDVVHQTSQDNIDFQPDHTHQQFNSNKDQNHQDLASFNGNSIVVGGGYIVSSKQEALVQVHENKEIQTSLNLILSTQKKLLVSKAAQSSIESARMDSYRLPYQRPINKDQSIQMSLLSNRNSNVRVSRDNSINVEIISPQKIMVDQGIQFEIMPIEEESKNILKTSQTEREMMSSISDIEREKQTNRSKDLQQSQVIAESQPEISKLKQKIQNRANSVDMEQEVQQRYMTQNLFNDDKLERRTQQVPNISKMQDLKYIQEIKEYTQFVQQLSKDAFDSNFLDQFIGGGQNVDSSQSYPVSIDNRTPTDQVSLIAQKQAIGKKRPESGNYSRHIQNSNKSAATQAYTPASNAQCTSNLTNYYQNQISALNNSTNYSSSVNQSKIKSIKSPKNTMTLNKSGGIMNTQQDSKVNQVNDSIHMNKSNVHQRAKSQASINQQRGAKIHQKRMNQVSKVNLKLNQSAIDQTMLSSGNKPVNKSMIAMNQINQSYNSTRNILNVLHFNNSGFNSVKNSDQHYQQQFRAKTPLRQQQSQQQKQFQFASNRNHQQSNNHTSGNMNVNSQNQQKNIPTSTKNKNILSLQKLLEGTNQSILQGLNQDLNHLNVPESLLGWTGNTNELGFQSPNIYQPQQQQKQTQSVPALQQNFITNQIHMNEIKNPLSFDITAQIANYNILEHIQQQQAMPQKNLADNLNQNHAPTLNHQQTNNLRQKLNNLNSTQNYHQNLLSYGQSPSSQYQQNLNNIYLDISSVKQQQNNTGFSNQQQYHQQKQNMYILNNCGQLGTIEESRQSEAQTSHQQNEGDKRSNLSSSSINQNHINSSKNGSSSGQPSLLYQNKHQNNVNFNHTQPLQQQQQQMRQQLTIQAKNNGQNLSAMISPQSNNAISFNNGFNKSNTYNFQQNQQILNNYGVINVNNTQPNNPLQLQTISNDSQNERGGLIQ